MADLILVFLRLDSRFSLGVCVYLLCCWTSACGGLTVQRSQLDPQKKTLAVRHSPKRCRYCLSAPGSSMSRLAAQPAGEQAS